MTDAKRPGKKEFSERYATGEIPWDIGRAQSEFVRLFEAGEITGSVLDVGCGTGENALFLAGHGIEVTGIDFVPQAIRKARAKAEQRGLKARFEEGDALNLQLGGKKFDTVIDSGVFHVFSDADRPGYVQNIVSALKPGGRLHILCWSNLEPGDEGPRRVSPEELRETFSPGWEIREIRPTHFEADLDNGTPRAWLMTAIREGRNGDGEEK
jgi:SAM-dependent methyltransferase